MNSGSGHTTLVTTAAYLELVYSLTSVLYCACLVLDMLRIVRSCAGGLLSTWLYEEAGIVVCMKDAAPACRKRIWGRTAVAAHMYIRVVVSTVLYRTLILGW